MAELISPNSQLSVGSAEPEVYVDFEFHAGVFHLVVGNAATVPAHAVRISFTPMLRWADKKKPFSRLPLFERLEFLAPGRKIVGVIGDLPTFFRLNRQTKFVIKIGYQNQAGHAFTRKITHDLSIYTDWPAPLERAK